MRCLSGGRSAITRCSSRAVSSSRRSGDSTSLITTDLAARDVLRYFDIAAPLHHEDEELHVFPPLLAQGSPVVVALVQQLQADHAAMAADWAQARVPLQALAEGQLMAFSAEHEALLARFAARYGAHIRHEEDSAYPAAQALLPEATQQAMGVEMARRRGAR